MKQRITLSLLFAVGALLSACSPITYDYLIKPEGDEVDVTLPSEITLTGELYAVDDTAIYMISKTYSARFEPPLMPNVLLCLPFKQLKSVHVNGYNDRTWVIPVVLLQVVPAVMMGIAADKYEHGTGWDWFAAFMIPGLIAGALFEASTPRAPHADWPFPLNQIDDLRKYARYPRGLPPGAVEAFRKQHQQTGLRYLD